MSKQTSKERIKEANEVWPKLVAKATATNEGFSLHVTVDDVSVISFALGCASGMELGLEEREAEDVDR